MLAHVTGHIRVGGLGPLGAALGEQETSLPFAEAFMVTRGQGGRARIMNQIFKMV